MRNEVICTDDNHKKFTIKKETLLLLNNTVTLDYEHRKHKKLNQVLYAIESLRKNYKIGKGSSLTFLSTEE